MNKEDLILTHFYAFLQTYYPEDYPKGKIPVCVYLLFDVFKAGYLAREEE